MKDLSATLRTRIPNRCLNKTLLFKKLFKIFIVSPGLQQRYKQNGEIMRELPINHDRASHKPQRELSPCSISLET